MSDSTTTSTADSKPASVQAPQTTVSSIKPLAQPVYGRSVRLLNSGIGKYIGYGIVILIILLIIYYACTKKKSSTSDDDEEDDSDKNYVENYVQKLMDKQHRNFSA